MNLNEFNHSYLTEELLNKQIFSWLKSWVIWEYVPSFTSWRCCVPQVVFFPPSHQRHQQYQQLNSSPVRSEHVWALGSNKDNRDKSQVKSFWGLGAPAAAWRVWHDGSFKSLGPFWILVGSGAVDVFGLPPGILDMVNGNYDYGNIKCYSTNGLQPMVYHVLFIRGWVEGMFCCKMWEHVGRSSYSYIYIYISKYTDF